MQTSFPVEKLVVKNISYEFTEEIVNEQDAEFEFIIEFEPIIIEDSERSLVLEYIGFSSPEFEKAIYSTGRSFSAKDELEPSSIYLQNVHNPIDLKFFRIEKEGNTEFFEFEVLFNFEYEGTTCKNTSRKFEFRNK